MMIKLRPVALCCVASVVLCQCRCVNACIGFFRDHPSKEHDSRARGNTSARPMTVDEFIAANAHRRLTSDVLKSRFRVADSNSDGLLTPGEMEEHRIRAAHNKRKRASA